MFKKISDFYGKNKNKINIIVVAVLLILCIVGIRGCINNNLVAENLKIANDSLNMKIVEYVDQNNNVHARVRELELSKSEMKTLNENLKNHYNNKIDSFANVLNVKNKEIQSYISIISKSTGSGKGKIDTIYQPSKSNTIDTSYNFNSNDGFLVYNGIFGKEGLKYDYEYTLALNAIRLSKKKGFLGLRKEFYWDISTNNKNAKITGLEQFTQSPVSKLKRFSIVAGPSVGLDNNFKFKVQPISVTIGVKIIDF